MGKRIVKVFRHANSTANDPDAHRGIPEEDLAFANVNAELDDEGKGQCADLAPKLWPEYGINPLRTAVATSRFTRAIQTATLLGFPMSMQTPYGQIGEVEHGMDLDELRAMVRQNRIPDIALVAARKALRNPPPEGVWFSHGLLIAGMCIELKMGNQFERLVPDKCEMRILEF